MKSILTGREALKDAISKSGGGKFLKVTDGNFATIRFMQELDEDGSLYDEGRGTGRGFVEHSNPADYRQSFLCTSESEGKCLGCERLPQNPKWRPKGRLFFNVLVRGANGVDDEVKIYTTSISKKGLAQQIVDYTEENGSLCDRDYKLKRTGSGQNDTTYTLTPRSPSPLTASDEAAELIDLESVVRNIDYDAQVELIDGEADSAW